MLEYLFWKDDSSEALHLSIVEVTLCGSETRVYHAVKHDTSRARNRLKNYIFKFCFQAFQILFESAVNHEFICYKRTVRSIIPNSGIISIRYITNPARLEHTFYQPTFLRQSFWLSLSTMSSGRHTRPASV